MTRLPEADKKYKTILGGLEILVTDVIGNRVEYRNFLGTRKSIAIGLFFDYFEE